MTRTAPLVITGFVLLAALWAILPKAISWAQGAGIRPGLWEVEQVFEIPDVPEGGFRSQWRHCVQEEVATKGPIFPHFDRSRTAPQAGECRIENLQYPERGRVTYEIHCGKEATRIKVEYRYTETSFEGTSRMVSQGRNFSYNMKGRYIGPCKG